jgi:resuscitation-promoting factor RpfB
LLPKRTFAHIPVKITLLLAGGAIAWASFAGAPASGAAHQPGDPARAVALVAYGTAARPVATPTTPVGTPTASATPTRQPAKRPRPHRRHRHRHQGHRHHRSRRIRHRQHHRRPHRHAKRHRIHRLPRRPQRIAWSLLATFHWAHRQFRYLELLWNRESGWNRFACNPYSGAYGIPQALPASKMASAGPDFRSNARTQILWGMRYIRGSYVTPYRAWLHEMHYGWY